MGCFHHAWAWTPNLRTPRPIPWFIIICPYVPGQNWPWMKPSTNSRIDEAHIWAIWARACARAAGIGRKPWSSIDQPISQAKKMIGNWMVGWWMDCSNHSYWNLGHHQPTNQALFLSLWSIVVVPIASTVLPSAPNINESRTKSWGPKMKKQLFCPTLCSRLISNRVINQKYI